MYDVTLINLAPDARTAATLLVPVERQGLSGDELRCLLEGFCDLDPVASAVVDPEIRVRSPVGTFLIRLGLKKLILYDVRNRDLPAQSFTVPELMAELDGSAISARAQTVMAHRQAMSAAAVAAPVLPPVGKPSHPRLCAGLATAAGILLGVLAWLWWPPAGEGSPRVVPVAAADVPPLCATLAGVYLTGTEPGRHGIALNSGGELTLFELQAVAAPRVVRPGFRWVRRETRLGLATDQPGGLIEVADNSTLVYCGETYRRIP